MESFFQMALIFSPSAGANKELEMHCSIGGIKLGDIFAGGTATVLFV
jgi:hypothetical protein